jgi:DsbC/DsbD-like thiol-disulfide interchange protein
MALLRLGKLTGDVRYTQAAQRTLDSMYAQMVRQPTSSEAALLAVAMWLGRDPAITKPAETRAPDARESRPPVTVELFASATRVTPGETIDVTIELDIADPWHIYATSPDAKFLLPTRVTLDGGKFIQAGDLHAPKSISKIDAVLKATVESYSGRIVFRTALAVSKNAPKGPAPVTITVQYQPCNNQHCLPPETVQLVLPITIK